MSRLRFFFIFLACLTLQPARLRSQTQPPGVSGSPPANVAAIANPKTPEEFFARARQLSDLDAAGIPFHLKATYVALGSVGYQDGAEVSGNGTIEIWWLSKDLWRRETTLAGYRTVFIRDGGKTQIYGTSNYIPLRLRQAEQAAVVKISSQAAASEDWKLKRTKVSGVNLIILSPAESARISHADPALPNKPAPILLQDYFSPDGILRIRRHGEFITFYNRFQPFQGLVVPRSTEVALGQSRLVTVSIDALEPLAPGNATQARITEVPKNLQLAARRILMPSKVVRGRIIRQIAPVYPPSAVAARQQGPVEICATIDDTGHVREPYLISSAGPLLDRAALTAVRQWTYKPLTLDGYPVNVETTITVIFSLGK